MVGLTGLERRVVVGIAAFAASNNPMVILSTYSLGSCLGIGVYDPLYKVGGIVHVMLPDSTISPDKAAAKPGMFIDTGLPALLTAVCQLKGAVNRLAVTVAGGAQIMDATGYFNIGKRNRDALQAQFQRFGLAVSAEEVGGMVNRTMHLHVGTGQIRLKVSGEAQERTLWTP